MNSLRLSIAILTLAAANVHAGEPATSEFGQRP